LTSKRQATFPRETCQELGVKPGDTLRVVRQVVDGETRWMLVPLSAARPAWFGRFRSYARGRAHGMDQVRRSIEEARRGGRI
jgi:bifunctional DNA-binding transcriptional regulator/antitoxin component of YhaV-PrlF toxin-antitoxin module